MADAGLVVICTFISPCNRDRQMMRSIFDHNQFLKVYLETPLAVCEDRGPKVLKKINRDQ